ncbi:MULTISPECIES: hypothetical protein [unclassified Mycobacterium]|uniref:hypothetical protein n=1 Tax=unclassified Mycobacterium TaxID=2642494 RepID=UPI00073FB739|nr:MULTISPECIES: hypothetical protein [unclassified Mycobacterium]KUH83018.1 hypothetical protein AU187_03405 [Mycobacterium sp. IS-1556]KUH83204.1 hypothetical protein AU185_05360 [Mycobacterium sp. GA-0227b]KUH84386.1 hypothetical protein AU186_21200 [Mycobacterium sp. GA-1999]
MPYALIRQRFTDYTRWRTAFDSVTEVRRAAGMNLVFVALNAADQQEAIVLFEVTDPQKAREHAGSQLLADAHQRAGVIDGSSHTLLLHGVQ